MESARLNQGVTDKFIEWVEGDLARMAVQLNAAALRAGKLEDEVHFRPVARIEIDKKGLAKDVIELINRRIE